MLRVMSETWVEMIRSDVAAGESNERGFVVAMICGFEPMVRISVSRAASNLVECYIRQPTNSLATLTV